MDYAAKLEAERQRKRAAIQASQEIAPLPKIKNKERRARAFESFKFFCETYFPDVFYLAWSTIHLEVIKTIESVVNNGEIYTLAMPRGSGKTTLCQLAVLWAALTGKRKFCVLIASNANRADGLLEDLKTWLETNDKLLEDFPEVCYPIRKLEHISQRQRGQMYKGKHTRINWKASILVLPTIEGSPSSGVCIMTSGMTGSGIRGLSYTTPEGDKRRPDLVLADDPQDRESAQSEEQCNTRERIIKADILGMAGASKKIALLITITVIAENDLAQRLLDRSRNPEFKGRRFQLLDAMPTNVDLWNQYRQIREVELQNDGDGSKATEFYKEHQAEMDAGAVATWPERFNSDEISAIQNAMNLKFRDESAFLSEYQNTPTLKVEDGTSFDASNVSACVSGYARGVIPATCQFLTAFIDVHKSLLYWTLCAWERDFNGVVVDYGVTPKQRRSYFQANEASPTLSQVFPDTTLESAIYAGLTETVSGFFEKEFTRDDGASIDVRRVLIDANWGPMTDLVYQFIAESPFRARLNPSHGQYLGASSKPFSEIQIKKGDYVGAHWRMPNESKRRGLRHVLIDTNYWKTFVFQRLAARPGDLGRLSIDGKPEEHLLFASHLASEYCVPTEARGRKVDEWKIRGRGADNHWFDCLVGAAVAANMEGARLPQGSAKQFVRRSRRIGAFNNIKSFARKVR